MSSPPPSPYEAATETSQQSALTYLTQSYHTDNPGIRDMLQDIATEEFGHLEVVDLLIEQHTNKASANLQDKAYQSTLFSIRGPGPHLVDSTSDAVSSGLKPTLGFTMVPINGRSWTPASRRVPSTPKRGPG
jgi:Mn-containing catalase